METPQHIKDAIEIGVKELSRQSTAPDKETANWMESDIRRGAEFGYSLSQKEIEELREENRKLKGGSSKLLEALKEIHKDIYEYDLEEQFGLEEYDYIKSAIQAYES